MDELEQTVASANSKVARWSSVAVTKQDPENADSQKQTILKWNQIYKLFDARSEAEQDEVFGAVNSYFLCNGASPKGRYSKDIRTGSGKSASSGDVVRITGKLEGEIRQFLRGRLEDSYIYLKNNPAVVEDQTLVARAQNAGIPKNLSWLMADWLGKDCEYFTPEESSVYGRLRSSKIANAVIKYSASVPTQDRVMEAAPESKIPYNAVVSQKMNGHVDPLY